ncbi:MAG: endonuclease/exonuclease/phosphatase family protein [Bacteroidota bacterium]
MIPRLSKPFIKRILLWINLFSIISLICAYLAPYISPVVFWPIAFFGLAFPVIVLINAVISLIWLFISPRFALLSLILILAGIRPIKNEYQWKSNKTDNIKTGISIVSYNVHDFSGINDGVRHHSVQQEIFTFIRSHKPQIICLQDLPVYWKERCTTLDGFARELNMKSIYINSFAGDTVRSFNSTALLTSYTKIGFGELSDPNNLSFAVYNDLQIGTDTLRVYSVHLSSIMLFGEKSMLTASGLVTGDKSGMPRQMFRIIRKLRAAFIRRATQADILKANILRSPFPVIVCGDFNDTPLSYAIHTIRKGLKDSFIEKGYGFGRTYIGSNVPLRIDNVFADPSFYVSKHEVVNIRLSDHLPVLTHLWLEKKPVSLNGK